MNAKFRYRLFFCIAFICSSLGAVHAQKISSVHKPLDFDYWLTLKEAQNAYESGDFGDALRYAENAKRQRKDISVWEVYVLDQTQKNARVRKSGDYIDDLLPVLKEKEYNDAVAIINKHVELRGKDFFHGRFSELQKWVADDYKYPEADFIIGKIYRLEGENSFAQQYLNEVCNNFDRLDIPAMRYDILYEMAELAKDQNDMEAYEKNLELILKDDDLYKDTRFMNALLRQINQNNATAVEKFFLLYRSSNDISIRALEELGQYYTKIGKPEKALQCVALGSIASVTKIEDILKDRLIDYTYISFPDLLTKAAQYNDILVWGNENRIWEMFYELARTAEGQNKLLFSQELFSILAKYDPEPYWRKEAEYHIRH